MAIKGYFFNSVKNGDVYDRPYEANDFTKYLSEIVGSGIFANPSTNMQVAATEGMTSKVSTGTAWLEGIKIINETDFSINFEPADIILNRIDSVVLYVDYAARAVGIKVKKGAYGMNNEALPPSYTRNKALIEFVLAEVRVSKQTTRITQSMITDTRADSKKCGWVTGLIDQVDTSALFDQWKTAYEEQYAANDLSFEIWFEELKSELHQILPVNIIKREYISTENQNTISIPSEIGYIASRDFVDVYINGFKLPESEYSKTNEAITLKFKLIADNTVELIVTKSAE